jgi:hypothetical protein
MRRDVLLLRVSLVVLVGVVVWCVRNAHKSAVPGATVEEAAEPSRSPPSIPKASAWNSYEPIAVAGPAVNPLGAGATGTALATRFGLPGFAKRREYVVIDAAPVTRAAALVVNYRYDEERPKELRCGNLEAISWSAPLERGELFEFGRMSVNTFVEGNWTPVNPPVPFESNNPYFVIESYARDGPNKSLHEVLVVYQVDRGRYDWTGELAAERQLGAVEELIDVTKVQGREAPRVEHSTRLLTGAPKGEEFAAVRRNEIGEIVERRGGPLPAFSWGDHARYPEYVRFFLGRRQR